MSNHAYANVWMRGFSAETLLPQLEALLDTVPFSTTLPGFLSLVVRAVSPAETPFVEQDLRRAPLSAAEIIEWGREHVSADCAFEVSACTDLWAWDADQARWSQFPQRVEIICNGPEYDDAVCAESGHFQIDLGFEHSVYRSCGDAWVWSATGGRARASHRGGIPRSDVGCAEPE